MAKSKSDEFRHKVITDPVHGDIGLSRLEVDLINTQSFQRLRRLKQLGLATLVYPSASHSRFSHSLGVFHIMSRAIDLMVRRDKFSDAERRLLRIAALLHDIGHYPYSHLVEKLDRDPYRKSLLGSNRRGKPPCAYPDHEELSAFIVTTRKDITSVLDAAGVDPADIASIIRGQHSQPRYNQLIHSTLDLDRMDYLEEQADTQPKASAIGRLCRALRDRLPPKLVGEVSSLTRKDGTRSEELTRFVTRRGDQLETVAKTCRIPIECWLWEDPKDVAFEKFGPLMSMSEAASVSPEVSAELVRLLDKTGTTAPLIEKPSSILYHLSSLKLQMARLYVVEEDEAKIAKAEREVKAWLKA